MEIEGPNNSSVNATFHPQGNTVEERDDSRTMMIFGGILNSPKNHGNLK